MQDQQVPFAPTLNRRKFPRKSFRKVITYLCLGQGEVVDGVEIGEGGISFKCRRELILEQKLIVSFFLPEGDFFSLRTTLRNVQTQGDEKIYGVSFDEVSIALKRQIRAYVARTSSSVSMSS